MALQREVSLHVGLVRVGEINRLLAVDEDLNVVPSAITSCVKNSLGLCGAVFMTVMSFLYMPSLVRPSG